MKKNSDGNINIKKIKYVYYIENSLHIDSINSRQIS